MTADFEALIDGRRRDLQIRLESVLSQLAAIRDARSGATDDDEHDPEGSTLSTEWSRAEGQRADVTRELADLDAALARVAEGRYGLCVSCGNTIPLERLRLLPAATLCVPCASNR
ncbi:MAG TPA: TraR/DksA C4-type zinc finger protein [Microbacterium sp.]|nr:TraR/DksA C4-type zinc finger protein [Microbacterium sp.]